MSEDSENWEPEL